MREGYQRTASRLIQLCDGLCEEVSMRLKGTVSVFSARHSSKGRVISAVRENANVFLFSAVTGQAEATKSLLHVGASDRF